MRTRCPAAVVIKALALNKRRRSREILTAIRRRRRRNQRDSTPRSRPLATITRRDINMRRVIRVRREFAFYAHHIYQRRRVQLVLRFFAISLRFLTIRLLRVFEYFLIVSIAFQRHLKVLTKRSVFHTFLAVINTKQRENVLSDKHIVFKFNFKR